MKVAYNIISLHTILRETFEGENFCEFFAVLWLFAKVFSIKFEGVASFGMAIREGFLCENCIFHQFVEVFSLKSFLLCGSQIVTFIGAIFFGLKAVCTFLLA